MAEGQIVVVDEQKMLEKILELPNQLEAAWTNLWIKDLPIDKENIKSIVIAGMGGSGIAGLLAAECFSAQITVPVTILNDYGLPNWVNEQTLVIAVSYSGNTEETIDVVKLAMEKKLRLVGITSGGKLDELGQIHGFPIVKIDYLSPPRAAIGHLYGSVLTLLAKIGVIPLTEKEFFTTVEELKNIVLKKSFLPKAEELAVQLSNKVPMVLAHAPLTSLAKRFQTQLNENSKTFAVSAALPEASHNIIVGLEYAIPEKMIVIFLESSYGFSRNIARKKIFQKLFESKEIPFIPLSVKTTNKLSEQLLLLHFGDLLSYYLAGVNGVDPTPIESIDFLKKELEKL